MSSIKAPKVFVSATSGDLRSIRALVKEALLKIGCMPVEQADFPPDYRTVADFLSHQIGGCDALVHIAGKRYGAEPNPDTLPPGTVRRSYTQLEYDIAKKLNKKVFTFVCGEDFSYDKCDAEPEVKSILQLAHRAMLISGNDKFEPVSSRDECAERITHLRLQLEELARELASEQRRQRFAWATVAAALIGLLAVSIAIWIAVEGTTKQTLQIANDTKQLKDATTDIRVTGETLKQEVDKSSAVQRDTATKVASVDQNVISLVESDLLETISEKAGIEAQQIKQLVLQSQSAGLDTLAFARRLSSEGRHEGAYGLARFVAETALLPKTANYHTAAEAILIAVDEKASLLKAPNTIATALAGYTEIEQLASRGQDAWRTLSSEEQRANETLFTDLSLLRALALAQMMTFGEPITAQSRITKAIEQVDGALARQPSDKVKTVKLRRRRAIYLAHKARWTSYAEAGALAAKALKEADEAVQLANELGTPGDELLALITRVNVRMLTFNFQSEVVARSMLEHILNDCKEGLALDVDAEVANERCELAAQLGRATLALTDVPNSEQEREQNLEEAIHQLKAALDESESQRHPYASRLAAMGLLRAQSINGRGYADANLAFELAKPYGFNAEEDKLILIDYAIATEYLNVAEDVAGLLRDSVNKFSVTVSPRTFVNANLGLARLLRARARMLNFSDEGPSPERDVSDGLEAIELVLTKFDAKKAPLVWAEANLRKGEMLRRQGFEFGDRASPPLRNALLVLSRDDNPRLWAEANWNLGLTLMALGPSQFDEAITSFQHSLSINTHSNFPGSFQSLCSSLAQAQFAAAKASSDEATKQKLRLAALTFAVAARESEQARDKMQTRYQSELDQLVKELTADLPENEHQQIDAEIERLKSEFAQNGIDPLK